MRQNPVRGERHALREQHADAAAGIGDFAGRASTLTYCDGSMAV